MPVEGCSHRHFAPLAFFWTEIPICEPLLTPSPREKKASLFIRMKTAFEVFGGPILEIPEVCVVSGAERKKSFCDRLAIRGVEGYTAQKIRVEGKQVYQELRFHSHRCGGVERTARSPGWSRDNHVSIFGTKIDRRVDQQRVLSQALLNQVKHQSQPNMYPPSRSHLPPTTGSVPIMVAKKQSEECYLIHVTGTTSIANFR